MRPLEPRPGANGGVELMKELNVKLWFHLSDYRDPEIVSALNDAGIRSLSSYSAAEIGPIAFECAKQQGYYHVAHSNVILECDHQTTVNFEGISVSKLLVTHLHSYATPIIRYEVGDFAVLDNRCRCGHNGQTISGIYGRGKHFMKLADGRLIPIALSTRRLLDAVSFTDVKVRQLEVGKITIEIGGRETIAAEEENRIRALMIERTDPTAQIEIIPRRNIDWSDSPKRLLYTSVVA
jgi:phenylacetate-CoA ligase